MLDTPVNVFSQMHHEETGDEGFPLLVLYGVRREEPVHKRMDVYGCPEEALNECQKTSVLYHLVVVLRERIGVESYRGIHPNHALELEQSFLCIGVIVGKYYDVYIYICDRGRKLFRRHIEYVTEDY